MESDNRIEQSDNITTKNDGVVRDSHDGIHVAFTKQELNQLRERIAKTAVLRKGIAPIIMGPMSAPVYGILTVDSVTGEIIPRK